ncbi:Regulator of sigma-W protease RasP [bioreactor metagenome]|uniref:Regulator of sigma-W protease RasP n=1 Tax=bioreactor metagenome TaxID=1076179 RepID=A0A645G198_9ZZZZ
MLFSQQAYYSTKVDGFTSETAASMQAGLRSGDVIIAVNNQKVNVFNDIAYAVMREGTSPCDITVMRNGEKIVINDVVFPTYTEKSVTYGELDFRTTVVGKSFGEALKQSVYQSFSTLKLIYQSLLDLITGKYGIDSVSGPVGTVEQIGEVAQNSDFRTLLFLYVFISMNLGVFNLLPLPALDGGRIIFVLLEMIRRKPIDPKYENYVHLAGFAVLIMFMGVITVLDIIKIVK